MLKGEKTNKIITVILILIITLAAVTIIYVNLSTDEEDNTQGQKDDQHNKIPSGNNDSDLELLSLIYEDTTNVYTLSMIEDFEDYTGYGGIIKPGWFPDIVVEGPFNYTGVKISTLLEEFSDLPDSYNITVTSSDDKTNEYNFSEINGNVEIFNGTSNESYTTGGVTMILAYKKEGEYLDETEGPLRIVFINDGEFTSSKLWPKFIVSIEIT